MLERGSRAVIAGLSFAVAGGEALVLTGRNGAGKTTLLRALAGMLSPASGTITLQGGAPDTPLAEQSHYVGHQNGVKTSLTVAENLMFWGEYLGTAPQLEVPHQGVQGTSPLAFTSVCGSVRERVKHALARFNLDALAAIPAGYLSAGQKRRLGLARLLVADRPVWLLDEPSVSLDAASVAILSAAINAHTAGGGIAVAATHLPLGLAAARELALSPVNGAAAQHKREAGL